ncbi:MAG: DUF362 domain-containing protein [Candidatus Helarchaeota archaeon]
MKEIIYFTTKEKRKEFTLKVLDIFKDQIKGTVFIKPNMVSYEEFPTTTHPETLETVIKYLQENGHEIICGDGQGIDVSNKKVEDHIIKKICKKYGIEFLNLYNEPMRKFKSPRGFTIKMSEIPFKADSIISLPNLKSHPHWELHMTGALKIVVGYFTTWERIKMHMHAYIPLAKNRWKMIAEANWFLMKQKESPTHLTIMDAMEPLIYANEIRHGGKPVKLRPGYLLASKCPTVLDIFGFDILKKVEPRYKNRDISYVPYIKYAIKYGICNSEYELKEVELD